MDEELELKITFDGKEYVTTDYWWEDRDFHFVTKDGKRLFFKNAWVSNIHFEGLESADDTTIIMSSTIWK